MGRKDSSWENQTATLKLSYELNETVRIFAGAYFNRNDAIDPGAWGYPGPESGKNYLVAGKAGAAFSLPADIGLEADGYYWTSRSSVGGGREVPAVPVPISVCLGNQDSRGGARLTLKQPDFLNTQWSARYEFSYFKTDDTREDVTPLGACLPVTPIMISWFTHRDRSERSDALVRSWHSPFSWMAPSA